MLIMKKSLPDISPRLVHPASRTSEGKKIEKSQPMDATVPDWQPGIRARSCQSGKLHSQFVACLAFLAAVLISLAAAGVVANYEMPLMFGDL